jgi:periplasmic protein TonB
MSYVNRTQDPRRKATAITGVVLVHAALGYVLVTGLQYTGIIAKPELKPIIDIPVEPTPTPTPLPTDEIVPEAATTPEFVAPTPPMDLSPPAPVPPRQFDPADVPGPTVLPIPTPSYFEPPRPQPPAFAPKRAAPRGDTSRWVTPDDYPSRELRDGVEGTTHFRVVVGTDGRVATCEVTGSSGNERLDAATCRNIERRARFEPATDGNGQKVVGTYTNSVRWRIPD